MIAMVWLPQKQMANAFWFNAPWLMYLKDRLVVIWQQLFGHVFGCVFGRVFGRAASSSAETVGAGSVGTGTVGAGSLGTETVTTALSASQALAAEDPCDVNQPRSQGLWGSPNLRESNYWAASSAPADMLWQMVSDLAGIASWHPLITATNAPLGQRAKPGLIYKAFRRYFPVSMPVFVERVLPGELLSVRLFPFPGLQERVTYRIVSTICGTCVLYSMTLSGWLSPLAWPMMKPQVTRVAAALVQAAEKAVSHANDPLYGANPQSDIF